MKGKKRILNAEIRAYKVQLITEEWENLWEMTLDEAKQLALTKKLDLMEMWRRWDIAIIKMLDFWKYLYKLKKVDRKNKAKWKSPDLKTLRITFKIGDHDLEIKRRQAEKFANWWHALKISLMMRWRENNYWDIADKKIRSFVDSLNEIYKLEWDIKRNWNTFLAMLKTIK